jgi:hypothetical protein
MRASPWLAAFLTCGAFTPNVKSVLSKSLGGILGGAQCWMCDYLILSEC